MLLHNQGHWVLCDFGSTTSFAGVYESTNAIMAAEEVIRKYTTPAYRAPEVRTQQYRSYFHFRICAIDSLAAIMVISFDVNYVLQMYDLYARERIDTKADIWVSKS